MVGSLCLLVILGSAAGSEPVGKVPDGSVLILDLSMNISDKPSEEGLDKYIDEAVWGPGVRSLYLLEVVDAVERAARDDRIVALFMQGSLLPENYGSGLAALSEVRDAIEVFKDAGKPVYAYTTDPSLRDYFLISAADHLYMNPFGVLGINGLASKSVFFGDAFKKYGIGVQTTKVGKYKSATERFTGNKMSDADREQASNLIHGLWDQITYEIADVRGVDGGEIKRLSQAEGFLVADEALEHGLVDAVGYFDEVIDVLEEGAAFDHDFETFAQVGIASYIRAEGFRSRSFFRDSGHKIAVVYAEGDIVDGEGFTNQVGAERIARDIRELREDPEVAAIVLRVNTPGGSAVAAELIQREVMLTQQSKPVVVSMGSYAASGGYWISASADRIYAEPTTITGSIGVWGLLFNFKEIANQHGFTFDGVKTSRFADIFSVSREKTEEEMALVQEFTDFIYDEFIEKVSQGRDLSLENVEEIAQGRVWTGLQASELGLVDELGGLSDAIHHAAQIAGVGDDYRLMQVPEKRSVEEALTELLIGPGDRPPVASVRTGLIGSALKWVRSELDVLSNFNDPLGIYARMPYTLVY